jgi:signal transduction histidine kinase/CheY-like chemotaxis protein
MEVSVSMAPLRDARDQISGAMAVIQDISQMKAVEKHRMQLEERLWQSQKMEAVGRLAGGVAHDFNNLLTAVSGYAVLIQSRFEAPDPIRTYADEILTSSDRAAQLTRQLLAFGRRQVLQPRVLDLNDVVRGMEGLLRRLVGEHIDLGTSLDPRLGSVRADQGQIEQVIMNLAVNARDVMPNGGKLTIETRNIDLDGSYFERHGRARTGPHVVLAVSDTGCGMNPETRSHVFEPFFTTKEQDQGTGLGLATVYGVVKQSDGDVWVYSELGQGASFKIYLPRIDQAPTPPKEGSRIQRRTATETLLLAEDSDAVRRLLREILRKAGYTVLEARNGAEALEISRTFDGVIDLLLTDMVMPQMSGRELGAHLAMKRPQMKVLFMSGYTEEAIVRNGVLAPGTAFLEKPFTSASVMARVRELLDEQGATS